MSDALATWLETAIGKAAKGYVESGCYAFPVHGVKDGKCTCGEDPCGKDNRNAGKHPYTKNGLKDATLDIAELGRLFGYRSALNISLLTGPESGIWVLDIDKDKGGNDSLNALEKEHGLLPNTLTSVTGNGCHFIFNYPKDIKIKNSTKHLGAGIDTRGMGGYIVAPPSKHRNGGEYHFDETASGNTADAPEWLIKALEPKPKPLPAPVAIAQSYDQKWEAAEVQRMLDMLDPGMPYQDWLNIGMALNSGGFTVNMWDSWSRGSDKYQAKDCERRWHGFNPQGEITMGTLVDMAKIHGWTPTPMERKPVDISNVLPMVQKITKPRASAPYAKMGFNPLEIKGMIGDTVRWINRYAIYKQPELALFNTLAFAGAVFGRRYCSPLNTRTNLYIVGTAQTGAGKDFSRKAITQLAFGSGLQDIIGSNAIRSDSGLLQSLKAHTSQLMMLDEFGLLLQALSNPQAPHYMRSITKTLMGLYSDSNSIYNHGNYADANTEAIVITCPNLCVYGTTTEASYVPSLKKTSIESGELNRFIILPCTPHLGYPERDVTILESDEDLVAQWEKFSPAKATDIGLLVNNHNVGPDPKIVSWGECDELRYKIQCRQTDKINSAATTRNLWSRLFENTVKIAIIFAIARDSEKPVTIPEDFDMAQSLVECSIEYMTDLATSSMSETAHESIHNEIIKELKTQGGTLSRTELLRKFRKIKKKEMDDILTGMLEQEVIAAATGNPEGDAKGRKKTSYSLAS